MKKIFAMLSMALVAVAMMAQQPVITFEKTEHDFGKINEADGRVSVVFSFKNEGMSALILSNVRASCGCTTPSWPKEPINPGETGEITVTYNPNGRPGHFSKTITITSNATEATKKLFIKGEVIPKPAQPAPNSYPVKMGALSMKSQNVNFGTVKKGQVVTREIEYANKTNEPVNIAIMMDGTKGFDADVTLMQVKPNETGKMLLSFSSKDNKTYGPVEMSAYVIVNDKIVKTDEYKVTLKGEVVEDFSQMTTQKRQTAPALQIPTTVDFGVVAAGKKNIKKHVAFTNNNADQLIVRRIYNANKHLQCSANGKVNGGKKGTFTVSLNTIDANGKPLTAGQYTRQVTLYTNDPQRSKTVITIKWTVK
ncbi:MAG: DUF1573 domain-containing protein [Paludibacteraceae bacterium]|jgi:hypothetical protein|nr:DUF1573 domain-containing protein [Paludibacteraceae bacterium]